MAQITATDYITGTDTGYELIDSVNTLIEAIRTTQSGTSFGTTAVLGSMFLDTTETIFGTNNVTTGRAHLKMCTVASPVKWVTLFTFDFNQGTTALGSGIDITSGGVSVGTVNARGGNVVINDIYAKTDSMATPVITGYDTVDFTGALIRVLSGTEQNILNYPAPTAGMIAYTTDSGRFLGRRATAWGSLQGTGKELVADGPFSGPNKIVISKAANTRVITQTPYTLPAALGGINTFLKSDGNNLVFGSADSKFIVLSPGTTTTNVDWSAGNVFKLTLPDVLGVTQAVHAITFTNAVSGNSIYLHLLSLSSSIRTYVTMPYNVSADDSSWSNTYSNSNTYGMNQIHVFKSSTTILKLEAIGGAIHASVFGIFA